MGLLSFFIFESLWGQFLETLNMPPKKTKELKKRVIGEKSAAEKREIEKMDFWKKAYPFFEDYVKAKNNPNMTLNRFFKTVATGINWTGKIDSLMKSFDRNPGKWVKSVARQTGPNGTGMGALNFQEIMEVKHIDEIDCKNLVMGYYEYLKVQLKFKTNGNEPNAPDANDVNCAELHSANNKRKKSKQDILEEIGINQAKGIDLF